MSIWLCDVFRECVMSVTRIKEKVFVRRAMQSTVSLTCSCSLSLSPNSNSQRIILSTVEEKERCIRRKAVLQAVSIAEKWRWDPVLVVRGSVCCKAYCCCWVAVGVGRPAFVFSFNPNVEGLTLMVRVKELDGSWRRCDYTIVSQKRQKKTKDVNC